MAQDARDAEKDSGGRYIAIMTGRLANGKIVVTAVYISRQLRACFSLMDDVFFLLPH